MTVAIDKIPLHAPDGYNVVVETPRGSRTKFAYDPEIGMFRAKKLLAMGFAFPFPFPQSGCVAWFETPFRCCSVSAESAPVA